jgi:NAD(P)-dependent dehydrogenase (short-subunit alcohol dehydrogenase family)
VINVAKAQFLLRVSYDDTIPLTLPPPHPAYTPILSQEFDGVMSVNLRGVFLCLKHQIPFMLATSDAPAIVITASIAGHKGGLGMSIYSTSKWALRGLAACAAKEYGPLGLR